MSSKSKKRGAGIRNMKKMKNEMLAIIVPIITLQIIILVAVSYYVSRGMIEDASERLLKTSVSGQTTKINDWIEDNLSALNSAKQTIESSGMTDEMLQDVIDSYYNYDSDYPEGIYVASSDGSYIIASGSGKDMSSPTTSEWYKHGLSTVNLSISSPYKDSSGNNIVSATGLLQEDGNKVRVIGADISLDAVTIIVNSSISMDGAASFLVDSNDMTILAHRDSSYIGQTLGSGQGSFMSDVASVLGKTTSFSGNIDDNMTVIKEVGHTGWILVSYIPDSVIFANIFRLRNAMIILGVIAVVLISEILAQVIRYLVRPISALTHNITDMSTGNFTIEIDSNGRDEIATMGKSLDSFSSSMRNMITDIRLSADDLNKQSETSSSAANEMHEAAMIQSQSMSQLKETVNQLSESVGEVAENATVLANVVADTREKGNEADKKMHETVDVSVKAKSEMEEVGAEMDRILENMSDLQAAINRVGDASEEITKIIGLIGEIAEETNLLSLNASIEAARAGEAGKGFAVVATQIGNLAVNSKNSVDTISGLIEQIHDLVKDAVNQADNSAKVIDESSGTIKGSVETFDEIYSNIQATNDIINEVLAKIEEVDKVATNVAAVSQEQAASSEEILATSETMVEQANNITTSSQTVADDSVELSKTSESLSEHMSRFTIEKADESETNVEDSEGKEE